MGNAPFEAPHRKAKNRMTMPSQDSLADLELPYILFTGPDDAADEAEDLDDEDLDDDWLDEEVDEEDDLDELDDLDEEDEVDAEAESS